MALLALGLNLSWLIAEGQASKDASRVASDPESTQTVAKVAPVVNAAPTDDSPPVSVADPVADGDSLGLVPPAPAGSEILPEPDSEAAATVIPPPDGMPPTGEPLPPSADTLSAETATPFTLPPVEMPSRPEDSSLEIQEPDSPTETGSAPLDDRGAPWIAAPGGFGALPSNRAGAEFSGPPSGFTLGNSGIPFGGVPVSESAFDGFNITATFSGTYTSNVTSSPGEPFAPIQDDFIFGLGGTVSYLSKATDWTFGGSYSGKYNQYLELTSYSGYNQGLGLVANYDGNRLSATATANVTYDQGNNRYYSSEFVQQTNYNFNLGARYRISSKTSLQGNIGQSFLTTSESSFNDTESFNLGLAGLWRYSKLTEFGPGIRYTYLTGGNRDSRSSIGPELLVNYKLGSKVDLNARVGVDFAQYGNGESADPTLAGSVGLTYNASKLWSMNLALFSGNQADASTADVFTQVNSVRLGYSRRIRRATLGLGVTYEINSYQTSNANSSPAPTDQNYFNVFGSLGTAVFANTYYASVFLQYSDQSGSASQTWDTVQSGLSISRSF